MARPRLQVAVAAADGSHVEVRSTVRLEGDVPYCDCYAVHARLEIFRAAKARPCPPPLVPVLASFSVLARVVGARAHTWDGWPLRVPCQILFYQRAFHAALFMLRF